MSKTRQRVSAATFARVRDYACDEPSFTIAFAAWELGLSTSAIAECVARLLEQGTIEEIEARSGPYAAVFAYAPVDASTTTVRRVYFGELDDARIGELAPARSVVVPHTHTVGSSGKPGRDRKRQKAGARIKRASA
jgi:DNA-binding Lrp family transcriptional regulator